jgi:coproporphyrinogen III oxidase-like Fe-S oxidoreductase
MNEYVMLRMRLADGIHQAQFEHRFHLPFATHFGNALARYVPMGFVKTTPDGYAFTPRGMYVSNAILSDILDFSDKCEKNY